MWLTTLMSLKELAKSPLCGLERLEAGYYEWKQLSISDVYCILLVQLEKIARLLLLLLCGKDFTLFVVHCVSKK